MKKAAPKQCAPEDVGLKSFFLGPQAENGEWVARLLSQAVEEWFLWRRSRYPDDGEAISKDDLTSQATTETRAHFERELAGLFRRFEKEVPKFSPRYMGHMLSEISLPALFGHIVTLLHNPNNVSGDSSRAGTVIEDEAISELLAMIGMNPKVGFGHFTSGGTLANFEALLRARNRQWKWLQVACSAKQQGIYNGDLMAAAHMGWTEFEEARSRINTEESFEEAGLLSIPLKTLRDLGQMYVDPVLLVPNHRHYSWPKGMKLMGFGTNSIWPIALDRHGRMSISDLENNIERAVREGRPILSVVSVAGTTELGQIDPVFGVTEALSAWARRGVHIWHHVDAAYGGFFAALMREASLPEDSVLNELKGLPFCNSVTLDPHKLGYVPYSSGAFLCSDRRDYKLQSMDAPYIRFSGDHERGPQTIEGSRSAAGAVATWLTARVIGLNAKGYGRILSRTIDNRAQLENHLRALPGVRIAPGCDTNVLAFTVANSGEALSLSNARVERVRNTFSTAGEGKFFVSGTRLGIESYGDCVNQFLKSWNADVDSDGVELVRMVLMNPFFSTQETRISFMEEFLEELKTVILRQ